MKPTEWLRQHISMNPISAELAASLNRARKGFVIPEHHQAALIDMGYMRHTAHGVMVTDLGHARALMVEGHGG